MIKTFLTNLFLKNRIYAKILKRKTNLEMYEKRRRTWCNDANKLNQWFVNVVSLLWFCFVSKRTRNMVHWSNSYWWTWWQIAKFYMSVSVDLVWIKFTNYMKFSTLVPQTMGRIFFKDSWNKDNVSNLSWD